MAPTARRILERVCGVSIKEKENWIYRLWDGVLARATPFDLLISSHPQTNYQNKKNIEAFLRYCRENNIVANWNYEDLIVGSLHTVNEVEKTIQMVYEKNYEKLDMFDFSDHVEEELPQHSHATKLEEQAMLFTLQNKFAESKHQYETTIAKQQIQVDQLQSRTETQKLEFNTVIGINQKLIQELHLNENVIEMQQRQIEKYEMAIIEETRKNLILSDRNEWLEAEIRSKNSEVMRLLKNLAVLLDTRSSARDELSEKLKQEQQYVQRLRQQLGIQQEALEEEEKKLKRFVDQIMKTNQTKSLELKQIVTERDEMRTVLNEICKTIQLDHLCDTNQYEPLLQKLQKKLM